MNSDDLFKIKKRIMFTKGDDAYFIAYNSLLILFDLQCSNANKTFRDYRKLAFLIDFISDPRLIGLVSECRTYSLKPSQSDRHDLSSAYSKAASRQHHVMRVLCALEVRGMLAITRGNESEGFDIHLNQEALPSDFLGNPLYEVERQNISSLRKIFRQLRTMKLDTMLDGLFSVYGVQKWHS